MQFTPGMVVAVACGTRDEYGNFHQIGTGRKPLRMNGARASGLEEADQESPEHTSYGVFRFLGFSAPPPLPCPEFPSPGFTLQVRASCPTQ